MKSLLVILFLSLHGIAMAQQTQSNSSGNDTLLNFLLQKHLLGAHITYNGQQKLVKGNKINDTLYIYINDKPKKTSLNKLNDRLQSLNDSLIHAGYLFNRLEPDSIRIQNKTLHVFYHYINTVPAKIDSLVVISDKKFPENIKRKLNKSLKRKPINLKNLNNIKRFINEKTGFKITTQPVINFYHGKKMVVLKVKKEASNLLDGMLGFNYDSEKEKLQLEGRIKSSFYNLFNSGEQLTFIWQRKNKYQQIQFNAKFPYIKSSNLGFENFFSSLRKDTVNFEIFNQTGLNYQIKNQTFGINFIFNFKALHNSSMSNRLAGLIYQNTIVPIKFDWSIYIQAQLNFNISDSKKNILYLQLISNERIWHNIFLSHNIQTYKTNQNELTTPTFIQNGIFRKIVNLENDFYRIISLKNDLIYHANHIKFYLIGDYMQTYSFNKLRKSYVNTGIGINYINKNQILTFEIIKPVQITYLSDYQYIYVNIKQSFKF